MSVSGVVTSVSPDWRGSALAVATLATDTVLSVVDAADFDEDGGWLVVADVDTPVEYLTVDEDADTITLAAAIGTAYEADEPVVVWDPTVEGGGARVREDIAEVMLPDAEQPVFAVVKHEQIPMAGIYSLVGATVVLEDDDGDDETSDWYVATVLGRESLVQALFVHAPRGLAMRDTLFAVPAGTTTEAPMLTRDASFSTSEWTLNAGRLTYTGPPCVAVVYAGVKWAANGTGYRRVIIRQSTVLDSLTINQVDPDTSGQPSYHSAAGVFTLADGESLYCDVRQTSGASLDLVKAELRAAIVGYQQ